MNQIMNKNNKNNNKSSNSLVFGLWPQTKIPHKNIWGNGGGGAYSTMVSKLVSDPAAPGSIPRIGDFFRWKNY